MIGMFIEGRRVAMVAALVLAAGSVQAQNRALRPVRVIEKRALLIGNAEYEHTKPLVNTIPDVRALAAALNRLGFDAVKREENLSLREMKTALRDFADRLEAGDLALFYYSGHGVQVDNENFLLPVDYESGTRQDEVPYEALAANRVQDMLEGTSARVRVLVLDACRNNPFSGTKSAGEGLARMNASAEGTLIAYATGAGTVASDNPGGELGLYMTHLLPELEESRVELWGAFKNTQAAVWEASGKRQFPALYDHVVGTVYLRGGPSGPLPDAPPPPSVRTSPPPREKTAAERWKEIKGTESPEELEEYIENYEHDPEAAVFVKLAELRLTRVETIRREREAEQAEVRLERAARAAWGAVLEAEDAEALEAFVEVYGKVPGAAELVGEARERLEVLRTTPREWENGMGMEFVLVPAGEFLMGSTSELALNNERPLTRVTISRGFYLGKYEVTQGQWEAVMGSKPSYFKKCGSDCPVEQVSWEDVQAFIAKLNAMDGRQRYRLPTEAEWEYAARAGTRTDTPAGDLRILGELNAPLLDGIAWYGGNSGVEYEGGADCSKWEEKQYSSRRCGPHPVGGKAPNEYGLHDMLGNVYEWVQDWEGEHPGGKVTDPTGPSSGSDRVLRGGSWVNFARGCWSATRGGFIPSMRLDFLGFRLLRTAE